MYGSGSGGVGALGLGVGTAGTLAMTGVSLVGMVAVAVFLLVVGAAMIGIARSVRVPRTPDGAPEA
jgi:hypothetical protein